MQSTTNPVALVRFRISAWLVLLLLPAIRPMACAADGASAAPASRLALEKSPYLRQHAHDPIDWYPWGEEAFAKARRENKPIFLSIGYSTCHWCHVMARESFSDPETARVLNAQFVAIKVDREERPDIDRLYMTFVQASTGGGGWPLSVWLTPELKPFFGGTYYPLADQPDLPAFKTVLARISAMWAKRRDEIQGQSDEMLAALRASVTTEATGADFAPAALRAAGLAKFTELFDAKQGGFEAAPKFPQPMALAFLLDVAATAPNRDQQAEARRMAFATLRALVRSSLHDPLGGGFHRYAVDAEWRLPHFEKSLVDQALLADAFVTASLLASDELRFAAAARDTLDYVRRNLTGPAGELYSAEDADSPLPSDPARHREGAFYLWTAAAIEHAVGAEDAAVFAYAFGMKSEGNLAGIAPPDEFAGDNVLWRAHTDAEAAVHFGIAETAAAAANARALAKLRTVQAARPRPSRDDKVVTAWNGLAISAFARAAQAFGDARLAADATRAAEFVQANLYDPSTGRLARSWRAGQRDREAFAEDYADLIHGLIDLYEATFELRWLQWAVRLQEKQNELFLDPAAGGYFANVATDASVLLRMKEDADNAEPAASSVAARNLARLAAMLHRDDWAQLARRTARSFAPRLERAPNAMPAMLVALGWVSGSAQQIFLQGEPDSVALPQFVAEVRKRFLPRHVLVRLDAKSTPFFAGQSPFVAELPPIKAGAVTAYVCQNFTCQLPTRDPAVFAKQLNPPMR